MRNNKIYFSFCIPNLMTVFRILLTPVFIFLLLKNKFTLAMITFITAGISDALDGFIARHLNQKTILGAYLDPLADKFLIISAFVCLPIFKIVPEWFSMIMIFRDFLMFFGVIVLMVKNRYCEINPTFLSKINTFSQIFLVFESLLILINSDFSIYHNILCWVTLASTVLSTMQYFRIWIVML